MPIADFEIDVDLVKDSAGNQHAVPRVIPNPMFVGKTVHYRSTRGEVTIEFNDLDLSDPPSPFHSPFLDANGKEKTVISSTEGPIPLSNKGKFFCRCFITPPGQPAAARIGWTPNSPGSGGNHEVR